MAGVSGFLPSLSEHSEYKEGSESINIVTEVDEEFHLPEEFESDMTHTVGRTEYKSTGSPKKYGVGALFNEDMNRTYIDSAFKIAQDCVNRFKIRIKTMSNKSEMDFRITEKDLYEFNEYIKNKLDSDPRLMQYFNSPSEYEDYMTEYQQSHLDITNDPAIIGNEKTFSVPTGKSVIVETTNPTQLLKILNAIKEHGNPGHSFEIIIDAGDENEEKFSWDGDGSDRIESIETDGAKLYSGDTPKDHPDQEQELSRSYSDDEMIKSFGSGDKKVYVIFYGNSGSESDPTFSRTYNSIESAAKGVKEVLNSKLGGSTTRNGKAHRIALEYSAFYNKSARDKWIRMPNLEQSIAKKQRGLDPDSDEYQKLEDKLNNEVSYPKPFKGDAWNDVETAMKGIKSFSKITESDINNAKSIVDEAYRLRENVPNKESREWLEKDLSYLRAVADLCKMQILSTPKSDRTLEQNDQLKAINKFLREVTLNNYESGTHYFSGACPGSGCIQKKPNGSWGIISNKTGEFWEQDYESEDKAKDALAAYHASKHFNDTEGAPIKIFSYGFNPDTAEVKGGSIDTMDNLIGSVLYSVSYTHLFHLTTQDYPAHIALNEYYDEMPDLVDALAEGWLSKQKDIYFQNAVLPAECPIDYLGRLKEYILVNQQEHQYDSATNSQIDAIVELVDSTLYKLKRLSNHQALFSEFDTEGCELTITTDEGSKRTAREGEEPVEFIQRMKDEKLEALKNQEVDAHDATFSRLSKFSESTRKYLTKK